MDTVTQASTLFAEGYNCAQSVFAAGATSEDDRDLRLTLSAGFGGGIGRSAGVCGVVTGAVLELSLRHGVVTVGNPDAKAEVYAVIQDFLTRFTELHGCTTCRELLGCDISTPEGMAEMRAQEYHKTRCAVFVRDAAILLASK